MFSFWDAISDLATIKASVPADIVVYQISLVEVCPGLGEPLPGVWDHLGEDTKPPDSCLDMFPVLLAVFSGVVLELDLLPVQLARSADRENKT